MVSNISVESGPGFSLQTPVDAHSLVVGQYLCSQHTRIFLQVFIFSIL